MSAPSKDDYLDDPEGYEAAWVRHEEHQETLRDWHAERLAEPED